MSTDAIINTYSYIYDTNWKDQLINYNGNNITYDEIDNPLTYGNNITYTWINGRELSTYTDTSENLEVTYSYNDEGIRTSKIINGVEHKYYLEGTNIIYENIGEDTLYYFYDSTGSIEGFKYNNDLYYYIKNGQNDIIGIIDDAGNKIASYTYDSWGQIISITDNLGNEITDPTHIGNINPFRYRSYYYDSETGLYYLNSRYYNPEMGRFINSDEFGGEIGEVLSHNTFAYCGNNPINKIDSNGHFAFALPLISLAIKTIVTVVVVALVLPVVKSVTKAIVKTIADVAPKTPSPIDKPYQAAYIDKSTNKLKKIGPKMTQAEAKTVIKTEGELEKIVGTKKNIGIYAYDQGYAKSLATSVGAYKLDQAHGRGYFGHYHDKNHKYHIWFGAPIMAN